ncbi:Rha family transcriptional regulator [Listeria fleischmannii]|uniref:Rha family transcriptional regulator n=1 Tax=Listeria fleischmannii TaxID=1069827 RepID=UPI00162ADCAB|nr:Rha family transcriptional regulator [Listeria fleischmannii]MBC1420183.1 Rha family transcriptional regulator [Listeria fleischmannii]
MNELVIMKNQEAVTSSLNVAEGFEKRHDHVLRDIQAVKEDVPNFGEMFMEATEPDTYGRERKIIYMNRDGFTLLAMGFTGKKALQFKLKYIEAFNQMEQYIKEEMDYSKLSPELQMTMKLGQALAKQEMATKRIESKVDNISEIVALNTTDWRKDARSLINKIAQLKGGFGAYQEVQADVYKELERRANCRLDIRLSNMRKNAALNGVSKSKINKMNKLDVIAEDKKLLEIYLAVVKEFAIKHKVA